jgi:SAM-dependent methyltransferase
VYGVEIEEESLKFAKENYNLPFILASGLDLPFIDSSFDCILASEVIEHVPDDSKLIEEIKRVAKKNCRIILTTESSEGLLPITDICHEGGTEYYKTYRIYTKKLLSELFETAGFKIEKIDYSLIFFVRVIMEITKIVAKIKNPSYQKQSDITFFSDTFAFRAYKMIFPLLMLAYYPDSFFSNFFKGNCIMVYARI